jgi:hypothetical protein
LVPAGALAHHTLRNRGLKTKKYICVHGHFYQPPRENPWLEAVELQDSASPCHDWNDVNGGKVDPSKAYGVQLPSGRSIAVFFYDGPVAQAVAFERLLTVGGRLAERLSSAADNDRTWDQLIHMATDGESYSHHARLQPGRRDHSARIREKSSTADALK